MSGKDFLRLSKLGSNCRISVVFFRAALRLSLTRLERERDPTLITLVMAAIESLPELERLSGISKEDIREMSFAPHKVSPNVDLAAIRALLGGLRRTSPKRRLETLAEEYFCSDNSQEISIFSARSIGFRNKIAHGNWLDENERSAAGDIVEALVYLCLSFDLQTSGFPARDGDSEGRRLLAVSRLEWAWQGFRQTTGTIL